LSSDDNNSIVSVSVEDSSKLFDVHRHVLYNECKGLRPALNVAKGRAQPLVLSLVSAECFDTVCRWVYSKELVLKELSTAGDELVQKHDYMKNDDGKASHGNTNLNPATDANDPSDQDFVHIEDDAKSDSAKPSDTNCPWYSGLDRPGRIYARLVDLYAFASTYNATQLKQVIMLAWQRFSLSCNSLPPVQVVDRAFARIDADEPLCRWIILWYSFYNGSVAFKAAKFGSSSPKFLAGVLDILYQKQAGRVQFDGLDKNWCDFHQHVDGKERVECEKTRETDPDVVARRAEELWDGTSSTRRFW
jgi:hypothetical protein